jgi:hypothetical protein
MLRKTTLLTKIKYRDLFPSFSPYVLCIVLWES